VIGYWVWLSSK